MSGWIGCGNGYRVLRQACVLLPGLCALAGCGPLLSAGTSDVAGVAGAGVASAFGHSPAAATGIGLGIAAGSNAALQYVERDVHGVEQDRIAQAAGKLQPGMIGTWGVVHDIPIEPNEHGEVMVTSVIGSPAFSCKQIVFSVDTMQDKQVSRRFYTATVCLDGKAWKWATAEPATARWGALQ
ncbi:MAG TPA: hypothetical protein VFN42_06565 [Acetobacteraceae bacterium]|nr:hypothetical protein [Acetobacteraceae bacterium]